jgi:hypothetical protein
MCAEFHTAMRARTPACTVICPTAADVILVLGSAHGESGSKFHPALNPARRTTDRSPWDFSADLITTVVMSGNAAREP